MEVNNANNVSENNNEAKETRGSRLLLGHDSRIGTKTIPPYRNNYHPKQVLESMNDMRIRNKFSDVTLVADSVEIPAHKMVLASCSPYFYAMLDSFEESKQERITLKEVDHQALVLLIEYAYTSEVTITEENVEALLPAANLLQFMDVRDACCEFLKAQLHPTNCLGIRAFADIHSCLDLLAYSESYIEQHFPEVVECEDFFDLTLQQVSKCISSDKLKVPSEEKVFECVIAWVRHDLENRRHHLASLMEHVRLPLLSQHYLFHRVEEEPLLKDDPQCDKYLIEALKYNFRGDDKRNFKTPRTKPRQYVGKVLLVAGGDESDARSVECFDFKEERWYQVAEMPTGRLGLGLAVLNGKVYAVGGIIDGQTLQTVDVYDPVLDQWSSCADMNDERYYLGVTVLDDLIYAVGGGDGSVGLFGANLNTAEVFDTKKESWKMISPMSTRRSFVGVGVLDGLLYAVGGVFESLSLSSVECYNPKTDTWLRVPDMLFRRAGAGVGVLNGTLYAVGGCDGSLLRKSVEAYDPDKKTWTPVADMAVCRRDAGVVAMNGLLYVVGGFDGHSHLSSVEVYNPEEDTWTMLPSCMGFGRSDAGVAIIDKSIMKATFC